MFGNNLKIQELERQKEELERQKEELAKIKEILDDKSPKVDISEFYVWELRGVSYIVKKEEKNIIGDSMFGLKRNVSGFHSKLIDIFNQQTVYEKSSESKIEREEYVGDLKSNVSRFEKSYSFEDQIGYLVPILEIEPDLLMYADRQVPTYVLQQLLYKLNDVDIKNPVLQKNKN